MPYTIINRKNQNNKLRKLQIIHCNDVGIISKGQIQIKTMKN